jgi:hypothetical protein
LHAGIKLSPFQATFGNEPKSPLERSVLSSALKPLLQFASLTKRMEIKDTDEEAGSSSDDSKDEQAVENALISEDEDTAVSASESDNSAATGDNASNESASENNSSSDHEGTVASVGDESTVESASEDARDKHDDEENERESANEDEENLELNVVQCLRRSGRKKVTFMDSQVNSESNDQDFTAETDSTTIQPCATCCVCGMESSSAHKCFGCGKNVHAICGKSEREGYGSLVKCFNCERTSKFSQIHEKVKTNTQTQAKKMLKNSAKKTPVVQLADNVFVPIPSVDRSKCDFQNLIAVIVEKTEDQYVLGSRSGYIKERFSRNGFEKCQTRFITREDVPDIWISLRTASGLASIDGRAQGMLKCNCKKSCLSSSCTCRKNNLLCNSRCHSSSSCNNKKQTVNFPRV